MIGVAALVATFSLIDGLEHFARQQISSNTSFNSIVVETETDKIINNLSVRKDTFQVIDYARFVQFRDANPQLVQANLDNTFNREIRVSGVDTAIGAMIHGLPVKNNQYAGGALEWLRPLPVICGLGLVAGYALLGAGWLILKSESRLRDHPGGVAARRGRPGCTDFG